MSIRKYKMEVFIAYFILKVFDTGFTFLRSWVPQTHLPFRWMTCHICSVAFHYTATKCKTCVQFSIKEPGWSSLSAWRNLESLATHGAHSEETVGFLLLQCSTGFVRHPRDLQVSVATGFCRVLIFASSQYLSVIYLFQVMIHWWVRKPPRGPNNCMFWAMIEAEGEVGYP